MKGTTMFRAWLACLPLAALVAAPVAAQAPIRHPHLHSALYELIQGRQELDAAGGRFGGHRKAALAAMDDAIRSIRLILEVKNDYPGVGLRKPEHYRKYKRYPHLQQVLADLREARQELHDAKAGFRGKKKQALADIDAAIKHVKLANDHFND